MPAHRYRVVVAAFVVVMLAGCSPEASRAQGGGLGADVGNTALPVQMHGDQTKNNPSFHTPVLGGVPSNAKGVSGWWTR